MENYTPATYVAHQSRLDRCVLQDGIGQVLTRGFWADNQSYTALYQVSRTRYVSGGSADFETIILR